MQLFGILNERVLREPNGTLILTLFYLLASLLSSFSLLWVLNARRRQRARAIKTPQSLAHRSSDDIQGIIAQLVDGFMSGLQKRRERAEPPRLPPSSLGEVAYKASSDRYRFLSPSYLERRDFYRLQNQYID